jgi:hypothetical protein
MDTTSNRPLIQIDDVVRPMTDEEYQKWLNEHQEGLNVTLLGDETGV